MASLSPQPYQVDTKSAGSSPLVWQNAAGVKKTVDENDPIPVTMANATIEASGIATEAKQDTQITAEQAILAKLQVGATSISIVRTTSTASAATLVIARATRAGLLIRNLDTANSVWVGPATVTMANGFLIEAGESLPLTWVGLLQIIDDGNHAAVAVIDEYY